MFLSYTHTNKMGEEMRDEKGDKNRTPRIQKQDAYFNGVDIQFSTADVNQNIHTA